MADRTISLYQTQIKYILTWLWHRTWDGFSRSHRQNEGLVWPRRDRRNMCPSLRPGIWKGLRYTSHHMFLIRPARNCEFVGYFCAHIRLPGKPRIFIAPNCIMPVIWQDYLSKNQTIFNYRWVNLQKLASWQGFIHFFF